MVLSSSDRKAKDKIVKKIYYQFLVWRTSESFLWLSLGNLANKFSLLNEY